MKSKFNLQIDLNSPKSKKNIKTPDILRKRDYSPMPIDSPKSIKHRISVVEVETEVSQEIEQKKQEYKEGKQSHK
tara:strand:+ start:2847 stop:3071 length:225 start_codon:yes stop_codon:yes gene_type:complete